MVRIGDVDYLESMLMQSGHGRVCFCADHKYAHIKGSLKQQVVRIPHLPGRSRFGGISDVD